VERLPPSNAGDAEMKTTIDMAREAGLFTHKEVQAELKAFEALIRADEREQGQKWFDAVTAQNKQLILAEREACAKVCDELLMWNEDDPGSSAAKAIRARGNI
jgi:hypothetical protein